MMPASVTSEIEDWSAGPEGTDSDIAEITALGLAAATEGGLTAAKLVGTHSVTLSPGATSTD
jgi:hypothetical protein